MGPTPEPYAIVLQLPDFLGQVTHAKNDDRQAGGIDLLLEVLCERIAPRLEKKGGSVKILGRHHDRKLGIWRELFGLEPKYFRVEAVGFDWVIHGYACQVVFTF